MTANAFKDMTVHFAKGQVIFREGDLGMEMYIIQSGTVAVDKKIGTTVRRLAVFGKGDFFGEMAVLEYAPRTATVTALEDCEMVKIDGSTFDQMIRQNTEIAVRMLRKFSVRLREMDKKLEALLLDRADEKPVLVFEAQESSGAIAVPDGPAIAVLVHKQANKEYPIHKKEVLVGRADPVTGIIPDVDLSDEENGRSVSRRHARLIFKDGLFHLAEEVGALNGTCVNGRRIRPGVLTPVQNGDQLLFGMIPLQIVVHASGS
jgi:CRP-like cAMP-binding protein